MEVKQILVAGLCCWIAIVASTNTTVPEPTAADALQNKTDLYYNTTVCYECINAKSDEECMQQGSANPCRSNQESCQTVVRYLGNQRLITKKCKQRKACINNLIQNAAVCRPNVADSFCYCCCHEDKCNAVSDQCWGEQRQEPPPIRQSSPEIPKTECEDMEEPSIVIPATTCTDGNSAGSICAMNEAEKIIMIQPVRRQCEKVNDGSYLWQDVDLATLLSEGVLCLPADEPQENSNVACSDENNLGSRCMYQCDEGYALEDMTSDAVVAPDRAVIECRVNIEEKEIGWNGAAPACKVLTCDESVLPPNDVIDRWCTDGSNFGSVCHFECRPGFGLSPSASASVACKANGPASVEWDREIPTCEPLSCEPFQVSDAVVTCSDEFRVNSTCEVTCADQGHVVFPITFESVTCLTDQTWTGAPPCCRKPCPPNVPMDMVIAMDSSSSITPRTWLRMQSFVKRLVKEFTVGPDSTNFAIFRYNDEPDHDTHIPFDAGHNEETLLEAIDRIPKNGTGTWTGLALEFAAKVALAPTSGNRASMPDLVIVITDGQNSRDDSVPDSIKHLKDMDATVMVVSVKPAKKLASKRFKMEHLVDIAAGVEANVFFPTSKRNLDVLDEIKAVVTEKVCANICQL